MQDNAVKQRGILKYKKEAQEQRKPVKKYKYTNIREGGTKKERKERNEGWERMEVGRVEK